jgi:hypothetical protein
MAEFESAYGEHGFGGLHVTEYTQEELEEDGLIPQIGFDCLNRWTQSGTLRMLRKERWKLLYDMQGAGQLYDLSADPLELDNMYGRPEVSDIQLEMLEELLAWTLRAADPLPPPRRRYVAKRDPRNYWSPYRSDGLPEGRK